MVFGLGDFYGEQACYLGWVEVVEGSVDVPSVESGVFTVVFVTDGFLVEGAVVWVLQRDVLESFELSHGAVADDLDLGLMWDRL